MKFILGLSAIMFFSTVSLAQQQERKFERIDANSAKSTFKTADENYVQAASFVDGLDNDNFVLNFLLTDPTSELSKLKKQLEDENCDDTSVRDGDWIEDCGQVEITPLVQIGYARAGWMEAGATWSFFIGFRSDGTGHFLNSTHLATLSEDVTADIDDKFDYKGTVTKTLKLERIQKLPAAE